MPNFKDLTGRKFHRLTAISRAHNSRSNQTQWLCRCDCGNEIVVRSASLLNGHTKSCGCYNDEIRKINTDQTTHGMSHTRIYHIWSKMKDRCLNPNARIYKYYGGKGVSMYEDWMDFENFYRWAIEHGYNDSLSIDRIDVDGNYNPSNCRWADKITQMNNTSRNVRVMYNGETFTVTQLERKLGFKRGTLEQRIFKLGVPFDLAVKYPAHQLPPKKIWAKEVI